MALGAPCQAEEGEGLSVAPWPVLGEGLVLDSSWRGMLQDREPPGGKEREPGADLLPPRLGEGLSL